MRFEESNAVARSVLEVFRAGGWAKDGFERVGGEVGRTDGGGSLGEMMVVGEQWRGRLRTERVESG